jgi:hypothetical protein
MSKFSKKKQLRLDFLEGEYKRLLAIHHVVDHYAYKEGRPPKEYLDDIMRIVYRHKERGLL